MRDYANGILPRPLRSMCLQFALAIGYRSASAFSAAFSQNFGVAPSTFARGLSASRVKPSGCSWRIRTFATTPADVVVWSRGAEVNVGFWVGPIVTLSKGSEGQQTSTKPCMRLH